MPRFRKKPVVVEAVKVADYRDGSDVPAWLIAAIEEHRVVVTPSTILIGTAEGDMRAQRADWIICGTKGELYPCKPDIFAEIYEPESI